MVLREEEVAAASAAQEAAARDAARAVRVIAGPGTGKSHAIEERARWLIEDRAARPDRIKVVSFTRASSTDLRLGVHRTLAVHEVRSPESVQVGTLHSLAFGALRRANLLTTYPVPPSVLDEWEQKNLVDEEFARMPPERTASRAKQIRESYEAFWATGEENPANYRPPSIAIEKTERTAFARFHRHRAQIYSYVLPGEMVRKCVEESQTGNLNLREQVRADHLIVDEFQDLNPMDLQFAQIIHDEGAVLWVSGDDDQSIYSFRYATPVGIQNFRQTYPEAVSHELAACFRCAPTVLRAAEQLLGSHSGPRRIAKSARSLLESAAPPVPGTVARWAFATGNEEAAGVASACAELIAAGEEPSAILILIVNKTPLTKGIEEALDTAGVPYDSLLSEPLKDSDVGRFILAVLRIACDSNDYVAHRVLLQTVRGVGVQTCLRIADGVAEQNVAFREIFYSVPMRSRFSGRQARALERAAAICGEISAWGCDEELSERRDDIRRLAVEYRSAGEADTWGEFIAALPGAMKLQELRDYTWADKQAERDGVLRKTRERIGESEPLLAPPPSGRVRLLTLHGSKGLQAKYVFIPGLEDDLFPGGARKKYPGLIEEAARLLYVGMTRARIGLVLSRANRRAHQGKWTQMAPSRFAASTGGAFAYHKAGFDDETVRALLSDGRSLP